MIYARQSISANIQDLLKTIGIFIMILDHIGYFFYPEITILRVIGRTAIPIFGFFAGWNISTPRLRVFFGWLLILICFQNHEHDMLLYIFIGQILLSFIDIQKLSLIFITLNLTCGIIFFLPLSVHIFNFLIVVGFMIAGKLSKVESRDKLLTMLWSTFSMYFLYVTYYFQFSRYIVLTAVLFICCYFALTKLKFDTGINVKVCRPIARNSLPIYILHLLIFRCIS